MLELNPPNPIAFWDIVKLALPYVVASGLAIIYSIWNGRRTQEDLAKLDTVVRARTAELNKLRSQIQQHSTESQVLNAKFESMMTHITDIKNMIRDMRDKQ